MRYRKKPVVIDAVQWFKGDPPLECMIPYGDSVTEHKGFYFIETLEGNHHVSHGDFIIRGVAGEFYPCKPDIFATTYEEIK